MKPGRNLRIKQYNNAAANEENITASESHAFAERIARRLRSGIAYTNLGSRVCISVNPGRDLENRNAISSKRAKRFNSEQLLDDAVEDASFLAHSPQADAESDHVLEIVENAYVHLVQSKEDQSIVLLGESSSGKSATHAYILQHLIAISPPRKSGSQTLHRIRVLDKILYPLSHAAQTHQNHPYSHRNKIFGNSIEYQFSSAGCIVGAKLILLDTGVTATHQSVPLIFSWMLTSLSVEEQDRLQISSSQKFYLISSKQQARFYKSYKEGMTSDAQSYTSFISHLRQFGFRDKHIDTFLVILAAILHLSNLKFVESLGASCEIEDSESSIAALSNLFGISKLKFKETMISRTLFEDQSTIGSRFTVILSAAEASERRNAFIHALYQRLIDWIVMRINKKMCKDEITGFQNHIQIIEFPGAKRIEQASSIFSFREFLSEYTDAALVCICLEQVSNLKEFHSEGLVDFATSTPIDIWKLELGKQEEFLRLLGKSTTKMEERGQGNRDFDLEFLESTKHIYDIQEPHEFTAYNLKFRASNWVSANDDGSQVITEFTKLLDRDVFSDTTKELLFSGTDKNRISCISNNLIEGILELKGSLADTNMWVVPHVRIADSIDSPLRLNLDVMARQVETLGLLHFSAAFGTKYTASFTHEELVQRYQDCAQVEKSISENSATACAAIALSFGYDNENFSIGNKSVFLSEICWRELESHYSLHQFQIYENEDAITINMDIAESAGGDFDGASSREPNVEPVSKIEVYEPKATIAAESISKGRRKWLCFTWCITWWIPSAVLRVCCKLKRKDIQVAWREKVALCFISAAICAFLLFFIIGLGQILCPLQKVLSEGEINGMTDINKPIIFMYGVYYQISDVVKDHVFNQNFLSVDAMTQTTLGHDVSAMFYKTTVWENYCQLPQPAGFDNIIRNIPKNAMKVWYPHQGNDPTTSRPIDYVKAVDYMRKGMVARDKQWIQSFLASDPTNNKIIVAYNNVYDMSSYASPSNTNNFLGTNVAKIVAELGGTGVDATQFFEQIRKAQGFHEWQQIMGCMNGLFLTGVVDHRLDEKCLISNYIMLSASAILCLIIGLKFLTALQCSGKRRPEDHDRYILVQVPCYTEGAESLRRTFESVLLSSYQDSRKLLFVIADGMIVGSGNDTPTPRIVLNVLGWENQQEPIALPFQSLGDGKRQFNMAKVYSGYYAIQTKMMPYIVVVKVGAPEEVNRPGNRGKRDSQLLIMNFLNKIHSDSAMSPMELDLVTHFRYRLNLDPRWFEYILWIDADTEIYRDSINRLVASMISDSKVIGICGETQVGNERESWVTMIQVYEYFISHHLAKQFESVFGAVTCLPGCFSMYRIKSSNKTAFLISNDVIKDYSLNKVDTLHLKNLLQLGEDRYLTTLMMKHFPGYKLSFSPDAKCKTQAPSVWKVFVSQRRRWINSTVHTLFALMQLQQLCGCCLFSMRVVVFIDLFSTLAQPSALVYFCYLVYSAFTDTGHGVPLFSLIMIAAIYGAQMVIFTLKGEFQHLGWMIIYLFAIPIYSFYLPIYAFWHFDDFSWGNTRIVVNEQGDRLYENDEDKFDPALIPLKKWSTCEQEHLAIQNFFVPPESTSLFNT